jgi:hypothetical protein
VTETNNPPPPPTQPTLVGAEPIPPRDPQRLAHLAQNRRLIVRRSLLSSALGGVIPLPVMDDFVAGRVRAGLFMKLAESRHVDLPQSSADLLSDPKEGSAIRNATLTAATLVALKLAWRKFFALLAAGRGADEMATTFQFATLVDHYCARMHVGGAVTRHQAAELRKIMHDTIDGMEKSALVAVFKDGGRVLGRSLLEAPRWMSERVAAYAQRWVGTGGNPDIPFDAAPPPPPAPSPEGGPAADSAARAESDRWLDRASRVVEDRIGGLGYDYLSALVERFEERWRTRPQEPETEGQTAGAPAAPTPAAPPAGGPGSA